MPKKSQKLLITSITTTLVISLTNTTVNATENPFAIDELFYGYMSLAHSGDKSCNMGKCGTALDGGCLFNKAGELRCGAGKHKEEKEAKEKYEKYIKCRAEKEREDSSNSTHQCTTPKFMEGKCGAG